VLFSCTCACACDCDSGVAVPDGASGGVADADADADAVAVADSGVEDSVEVVAAEVDAVDILGVPMPPGKGLTVPLGGTGILISSGLPGTMESGRPGILMRLATLL
jgi:hypothetical protein